LIAHRFPARAYPEGMVQTNWSAPDGWPLRVHDWPADVEKPRGSILFQAGRGDLLEKYLEACGHWHSLGWHISSMDWRGQGGSGRLAADPNVGHIDDFADWTGDLSAYWNDWVARTPGPHILIGHSMGGHLALRTMMERGIAPDALVLSAPMLGFSLGIIPIGLIVRLVSWAAGKWPERRAWPANEKPSFTGKGRQALLTHDDLRYADEQDWVKRHPELALGPPSLKWLAKAYQSTQWTEQPGRLEQLALPVLMFGTDADQLVSPVAIRRFAARIPGAELQMFGPEAAHELLREADPVRDAVLAQIDAFLDAKAPAR
jgi:lysophospholipase